jgi:hypothetical protein
MPTTATSIELKKLLARQVAEKIAHGTLDGFDVVMTNRRLGAVGNDGPKFVPGTSMFGPKQRQ